MQSCGSGSVAAAYHMQKKYNLSNNLTIRVKGGELFITADSKWREVWLKGSAELLYSSKIDSEKISRPYVLNNNMYIVRDNAVLKLN